MNPVQKISCLLLVAAALVSNPVSAFVPDPVPMNVKLYPQFITSIDTLSVAPLTHLHKHCLDDEQREMEMVGSIIHVTYSQHASSWMCLPETSDLPPTRAFEIGRFPPGKYAVRINLKKRDGTTEVLTTKEFVVPPKLTMASGLPRDNYSGLWTNWPAGWLPFEHGALTITHIGYYLSGSFLGYDDKGQPVWYFFTPDINSGSNNPDLTDPSVASFGRAWFKHPSAFLHSYQNYRAEVYQFTGAAANPDTAKAKATLMGKAVLTFDGTGQVQIYLNGSREPFMGFHRSDSQQY